MATQAFREWLIAHEGDIAYGINDFDDLREEFAQVIGRQATKGGDTPSVASEDQPVNLPAESPPAADESAIGE